METSADEAQRRDEPDDAVRPDETLGDESGAEQDPPSDDDYFVPV
jgi:hypothetical protein